MYKMIVLWVRWGWVDLMELFIYIDLSVTYKYRDLDCE